MITINPENRTSDDNVEFEFTVYGCGLVGTSKSVIGSQFVFEADYEVVPRVTVFPSIPFSWSVGRLKAGEYQFILKKGNNEPIIEVFSVSEDLLPFPEPAIPSIGFVGAIILAIGLVWIANKAFKTGAQKRAA